MFKLGHFIYIYDELGSKDHSSEPQHTIKYIAILYAVRFPRSNIE